MMSELTITRVTHAAVLLGFNGHSILTDPWFSQKPGYSPGEPLGISLDELPHLDGVVVSHGHYDHFDMEAFAAYPDKQLPIAVKRGIAATARNVGFTNVIELDAWETTTLGAVKVTAAPAKHKVPEITYVLEAEGLSVYFGADTLLIPELGEVAQRFPTLTWLWSRSMACAADVRGSGKSTQGQWRLMSQSEQEDLYDTIEWIPWRHCQQGLCDVVEMEYQGAYAPRSARPA
jgi:glyoxylase-like metal-dependent hydrolase (beta-lactamase superfamily II)